MNKALNYLKVFVYLAVALLANNECMADELIRTTAGNPICNHSIIRHYDVGKDVVCCHSNQPYFMLLDESSSTFYSLYLPINKVWDFEIYNDTVYFCGNTISSGVEFGVVGYFDVTLLASPTLVSVHYLHLDRTKSINALEVGHFAGQKHIVVIGEDKDSGLKTKRLLDLVDLSTLWAVYSDGTEGYKEILSDLAITKNYVVATSILPNGRKGRVWYFSKPTTPMAATIFNGSATYTDMDYPIKGKYLVRHRRDDEFVTACTSDTITAWPAVEYCLSYYDGLTYINSMFFWEPLYEPPFDQYPQLMDITIGRCIRPYVGNSVNVLLNGPSYNQSGLVNQSVIYEFPYGVWGYASSDGHVHNDVTLTSLNVADGYHIVSSGHYISDLKPVFDKTKNGNYNGSCFNKKPVEMIYRMLLFKQDGKELDPRAYSKIPIIIETYLKRQDTKVICSHISRDEEGDENDGIENQED